jgi:hypothetical protein
MRVLALFLLFFLAACATSTSSGGGSNSTTISQQQIVDTGASTIYDAVRMLHREWLPQRQGSFIIVADQNHLIWGMIRASDTPESLNRNAGLSRFMQKGGIEGVYQIEKMRDTAASGIWPDHIGDRDFLGAIIVWTRPPGD